MMGKEWSDEEVDLLKEIYPHYTNKELSNIFGRTYHSVIGKAQQFDLKKTQKHKTKYIQNLIVGPILAILKIIGLLTRKDMY